MIKVKGVMRGALKGLKEIEAEIKKKQQELFTEGRWERGRKTEPRARNFVDWSAETIVSIQCTKAHTHIFRPLDHSETPLFFSGAFISIFLIRCLSLALFPVLHSIYAPWFCHPFSLISISAWHFRLCLLTPILLFPPLGLCQAGLSFGIWPCGTYSHSHPSHRALPLHLFLGAGVCTWSNIYAGEGRSSGYSNIYIKPVLCSWKTAVMIVLNGYLYYFVTFLQTIQQNTLGVWLQRRQLKQIIKLVIVVLNWE